MLYFPWTADFVTGCQSIDDDHLRLAGMIDALIAASKIGFGTDLLMFQMRRLIAFTREHFEREENFMRGTSHQGLANHAQEHHKLLSQLEDFCGLLEINPPEAQPPIHGFLMSWLREHIITFDKKDHGIPLPIH
jgi:hemerythrin-like metal-binding protein